MATKIILRTLFVLFGVWVDSVGHHVSRHVKVLYWLRKRRKLHHNKCILKHFLPYNQLLVPQQKSYPGQSIVKMIFQ